MRDKYYRIEKVVVGRRKRMEKIWCLCVYNIWHSKLTCQSLIEDVKWVGISQSISYSCKWIVSFFFIFVLILLLFG
jgi:hypothetical protein